MDDGRREHRPEHRVSPPRRPDFLEADPGALRRRPENRRRTSRPRGADLPALPAERSLVAIARGLAAHAKLIVLDEPTARLPAADCARLFRVLHALRDQGHGILYVSHRLDEVYKVADTFAVLRDGHLVSHGPLAGRGPARLVHDIVGEELAATGPPRFRPTDRPS